MTHQLPDAPWRHRPGLDALLDVLGAGADEVRFVGGAVRDALLGVAVNDVDLATVHTPQDVVARLERAGIRAVPTGIDHGTITAVVDHRPYEITTLRSDVSTDGRRATVAFTEDWRADAQRRDFTINALYASATDGTITDFFGGLDDLAARRVRFIGDPAARIAEDHLRILRYFRFFARFGGTQADADAYAACVANANSLMALSRERIADELLKLLALPDPTVALHLMVDGGIFAPVLPEIDTTSLPRLAALLECERDAGAPASALVRLAALLPRDPAVGDAVTARLKLSNKARKRIAAALSPAPHAHSVRELAFRIGVEAACDQILLGHWGVPVDHCQLHEWDVPQLPIGGGALVALGLKAGPDVARALGEIREQWIAEDFPDAARVQEIAAQIVSKFQRAIQ